MPSPTPQTGSDDPTCPTCNQAFSSLRGMRVHHTTVHDTPLPNRHCTNCESAFYDPTSTRTYCPDCTTPPTPTNPERGNTTTTCLVCQQEFQYYPSEKAGHYCPQCVADPDVSCTAHLESTKQATVECAHCQTPLTVYQSEARTKTDHFCDRDCYRAWLSTTQRDAGKWTGEANPNWRGGTNHPPEERYGEGWPRAREHALKRDNHTCQRCGTTQNELGRNPDVHHITPVRTFNDPSNAHTLDNLISLCRNCHLAIERDNAPLPTDQ